MVLATNKKSGTHNIGGFTVELFNFNFYWINIDGHIIRPVRILALCKNRLIGMVIGLCILFGIVLVSQSFSRIPNTCSDGFEKYSHARNIPFRYICVVICHCFSILIGTHHLRYTHSWYIPNLYTAREVHTFM